MPKISQLPELETPTDNDLIVTVNDGVTKKISKINLLKEVDTNNLNSLVSHLGGIDNYVSVDDGGNLRLNGDSSSYTDLVFPLTQVKIGPNLKPDFIEAEFAYGFPQNNINEYMMIMVQMPHQWKMGTTLYPHVHWKQTKNLIPTFKIDYKWINIGDPVPLVWSTYSMNVAVKTYVSGEIHQINDGVGISGEGKTLSSMVLIKLYRDDNVYTGDALTYQFDIHYEIDSFGSDDIYEK